MIIVVSHSSFIDGKFHEVPVNTLIDVLIEKKEKFVFIRHSITGIFKSNAYFYEDGKLKNNQEIFTIQSILILRYLTECILTFFFIGFHFKEKIIFIGVDPLNALTGLLLKIFKRTKKFIFYTPDYSPKRFNNKILNNIYHLIDKTCVKYSDQVWNVSSRICGVREKMGLIDSKNIFLPNVPSSKYMKFFSNSKNKETLIILGKLENQIDYIGLFDSMVVLKSKIPSICLKIIGGGPQKSFYKNYVKDKKIDDRVYFLGQLNHENALEEISKSGIGLALYNGKWEFNYYGDSMKCREYFSFGLPVITTDTHSTVDELIKYKAGIVCDLNSQNYTEAVLKILNKYEEYSSNSYNLGKKYSDKNEQIIKNIYS
ncbi:MAG: glycosyltransferase [Candidatus Paceibacterota bacterium]